MDDPYSLGAYHYDSSLRSEAACEKDLGVLVSPDLRTTHDNSKRVAAVNMSFCRVTHEGFRLPFTSQLRLTTNPAHSRSIILQRPKVFS